MQFAAAAAFVFVALLAPTMAAPATGLVERDVEARAPAGKESLLQNFLS